MQSLQRGYLSQRNVQDLDNLNNFLELQVQDGSEKLGILFVVTAMGAGGLETYLVNLLHVMDLSKYKVTIVATGQQNDWYKAELKSLDVEYLYCPCGYSVWPFVGRIKEIMRQREIVAVCDFRNDFSAPTLWVAKRLGIKSRVAMYRSTRRGFKPDLFRNSYVAVMHYFTRRLATKVIANNPKILDNFYPRWQGDNKFAVVYNGIDIRKFAPATGNKQILKDLGISPDKIIVGHTGSFRAAKNHQGLLKTFGLVKQKVSNIHLLLVGDGLLRPRIEQMAASMGLESCVTLAGNRKDIPELLNVMDVFFYPSIYEGMPNALVEAMACAKPFVATNISEIAEIVPNDLHCQLFDVDDIEGQAEALRKLVSDINCAYSIGKRAREHVVSNFTIASSAEQLLQQLTEFTDH